MHVLFLSHYYPPESNAPANRVSELARTWVEAGHDVTVVTCTPNHPGGKPYPGYRNAWFQRERLHDVDVIRIATFLAPNKGVARRLLNYVSYLVGVFVNTPRLPKVDVVISTSPQFFAGLAGAIVAKAQRRPWVLEIRDIWPESVVTVGAMKKGLALRAVEALETWAYRAADQVVVVSRAFISHIAARGPLKRAVAVVENGVNLDLFSGEGGDGSFRRAHGLEGKVVLGYIGTHGMAHGLETVLRAALLTRDDPTISWLFVGAGAERDRLLALKAELQLDNVVMLEHQRREAMPAIWSSIDVSLVVLKRSDMFQRVIPSKMFEAMAMERPIILGVDGEARRILETGDCGLFIEPENSEALAAAARALASDPERRHRLGANGALFVRTEYDRRVLAGRYVRLLQHITTGASGVTRPSENG